MRKKIITLILSFLYTMFVIISISFIETSSFDFICNNVVKIILLSILLIILFNFILNEIFYLLDNYEVKKEKNYKFLKLFDEHPIIFSSILMILCYLIYIIAFYPLILSRDPSFQILQYFHIDNKYSYYSILLDKNVIITNHHPVIHTLLLGFCTKIGINLFNSANIGLFIYNIIQITIFVLTLSYTIKFMKELNIKVKYRFIVLLIYSLVPVFPFYMVSPVKDVIFSCLFILYVINYYKCIKLKDEIKIKEMIKIIVLCIFLFLFRNNGIHVFILSFPILILINKQNRKKFLIITTVVLSLFMIYSKVILPYNKITPSSVRETLSIPFQQTARYVKEHGDEVSKKEKKIIDKVLNYETLAKRYDPLIADPVKNEYNKYATKEDLKNYFKVWLSMFFKHPGTYISATINNTYGYFSPLSTNWYFYHKYNDTITKNGIDYHQNNLVNLREDLTYFGQIFPYIPVLGLIVNIGFSNWIILFMIFYLIYRKRYKEMCYLIPSIIITLVCIASPVNTYFRYAMPNIFSIFTLSAIFLNILGEINKSNFVLVKNKKI